MSDQPEKVAETEAARESDAEDSGGVPTERADRGSDRVTERVTGGGDKGADRGLTDFVRRAVSAGVGAASRSKDDIMRAAASEMRNWLERLDVNNEILKVLSKMVIEVKTEIRFRPTDDGKITPEATNDVKVKSRE
ncbi:MAG TPA: hypothetical protein VFH68_05925 [Polyangia bacterium]|jgi:hypothetical protein|nr:hypothetical protein [Polyangia bacterium]